jgi:adenine phosphoribosyltransferase
LKDLSNAIRDVPDFPKKGILFKDITTLLKDGKMLRKAVDALYEDYKDSKVDKVIGVEARGFIFAPAVAYKLGAGFVPVRKPGKLPAKTRSVTYELEYGTDTLQMHEDAITKGEKVLIIDDLLATGGTAAGVVKLVQELGGEVVGVGFLIELEFLKGREKLKDVEVNAIIKY